VSRCTIKPFLDFELDHSGIDDAAAPPDSCAAGSTIRHIEYWDYGNYRYESCGLNAQCVETNRYCPMWSLCTVKVAAQWFDADQKTNWRSSATAMALDRRAWAPRCETGMGGDRCRPTASASTIRVPTLPPYDTNAAVWARDGAYGGLCVAGPEDSRVGDRGADSVRRLECEVELTYAPAEILQATVAGSTIRILVPGTGTVTVTPAGKRVAKVSAASKNPPFKSATVQATDAGLVSVKPRLSKKSKRKLNRTGKLVLKIASRYVSAEGGEPIEATQKVKLTKRGKRR
jgi:hypothetical protein